MDENMKKWLQTETGSQTGTFTLDGIFRVHDAESKLKI